MAYARLCVADQAVWPEICYVNLKNIVARVEVAVDSRGVGLLPKWSQRGSVDADARYLVDRAEIERYVAVPEK